MSESKIRSIQPEMKLIWTNSSPTSDFAAQTLSLDLSGYSFVLIEGRVGSGNYVTERILIPIEETAKYCSRKQLVCTTSNFMSTSGTSTPYVYLRDVNATPTGITFSTAWRKTLMGTTAGTTGAGWMIPTRIWAE